MHDYINIFIPELDSKEPDIDMTRYFGGNNGVHNINSRIIVFKNGVLYSWGNTIYRSIDLNKPSVLVTVTAEASSSSVELNSLID